MRRLHIGPPVGPLLVLLAATQAVTALLAFIRAPVLVDVWPLPGTGEMTFILMASFFAASAASTTWSVLWGEPGSLVGIGLDYVVTFVPLAVFSVTLPADRGGGSMYLLVAALGGVAVGAAMLAWSVRRPLRDPRRTSGALRGAFLVFMVALLFAGGTLMAGVHDILPWPLTSESSLVVGTMFLGSASYFAYAIWRPRWTNAGGQLAGFLAYDLVLFLPLITRAGSVYTGWGINLWAYVAVIVASGILAVWYLLLAPDTRMFGGQASRALTEPGLDELAQHP